MEEKTRRQKLALTAAVWILSGLVFGLAVTAAVLARSANRAKTRLSYQYDRALTDMSDAVNESEQYLLKALAAGSARKTAEMLQEAARASAYAEGCLSLLPFDAQISAKISNYLVQVDDLAKVWAASAISDELRSSQVALKDSVIAADSLENGKKPAASGWSGFTDENYALLQELHGYAIDLGGILTELAENVSGRKNGWTKIEDTARELMADPFQDYPTLQYDGAYSEHMKHLTAKGLTGAELTREEGAAQVKKLFESLLAYAPEVRFLGENERSGIQLYSYEVGFREAEREKAFVELTRQGGMLCTMTFHRDVPEVKLSDAQCAQSAQAFLRAIGLSDMAKTESPVQTDLNGGTAVYTFCYCKNQIYCYADRVLVKVACDTGEILGYEGYAYLLNHCDRAESAEGSTVPTVSADAARAEVSPRLKIESVRECYLGNVYGSEDHFYEFRCTGLGHEFCIYIDAETGEEERIEITA